MEDFSVIITAGGISSRYGKKNKLLENIKDKTVIEETVHKFLDFKNVQEIIIPANETIKDNLLCLFKNTKIKIIAGGETRKKSVNNELNLVKCNYVLIHDGARPLVTKDIIQKTMDATMKRRHSHGMYFFGFAKSEKRIRRRGKKI